MLKIFVSLNCEFTSKMTILILPNKYSLITQLIFLHNFIIPYTLLLIQLEVR